MNRIPVSCLFLILAAVCAEADDGKAKSRFTGSYSGATKAGEQVVTDAATWEKVWKKVHSTVSPQPKLPAVDFEKHAVIAVFLGQRNTGGHGIRIKGVVEKEDFVEVVVLKTSPGPGAITTQALTQPYDMLIVPKPTKRVKFVVKGGEKRPPFPVRRPLPRR